MAGYQRVIWNGDAGDVWENRTDRPWYQLLCNWSNTCGVCAQYDRAIANSSWAIPLHFGCNCRQVVVAVGGRAQTSVDFRRTIRDLPADQKTACVGSSNLKLIEAGVVAWEDVVTPYRVRDLNEVVAIKGLDVATMLKHGVRASIAEKAFATVNTPAHLLVAAKRSELLARLKNAGMAEDQVRELIARGLSTRLVGRGPSGVQRAESTGATPEQIFRQALRSWAPAIATPKPIPNPPPTPITEKPIELRVVGDVSEEAVADAREALERVSVGLRTQLARFGRKVSIGPDMSHFMSQKDVKRRPRGWPEGASWMNCDGVCHDGDAIVTESYVSRFSGETVKSKQIGGVLLHELGHAVDSAFGVPSDSKGFARAYNRDVAKLDSQDRDDLSYFLQDGKAGRSEAWAELFGWIHGKGAGRHDIRAAFPNTVKWIEKFVSSPAYVDPKKRVGVKK